MSQLVYFHSTITPSDLDLQNNLVWTTCRRHIVFSMSGSSAETPKALRSKDVVRMEGLEAEALLIEILCGLHSPVVAETEILGQFRDFISKNKTHSWVKMWSSRIQLWLSVVKAVRERHLCGTGSQSYGSYLRKNLENIQQVDFLGAGSLVHEVLPWLAHKQNRLHVRDVTKVQAEFSGQEIISCFDQAARAAQALIIAAPLSHEAVAEWISARANEKTLIFDFRRDAREFSSELREKIPSGKWIDLDQIMASFENQRAELELKVRAAARAIESWKENEFAKMQIRPFGWEDLCG